MAEGLTWGGVDVSTFAVRVVDLSGLLALPGRRGEDLAVAGRDGRIRQERKPYEGRDFPLEFFIRGATPGGLVPPDGANAQFYANMDLLSQLCTQDVAPMVHTLPGTAAQQRRLDVEVMTGIDPSRWKAGMLAKVTVPFTSASTWWRGLAAISATFTLASGATRALTEWAGMSGRIDDALVTLGGGSTSGNNPLLTQVETGIGIGYNHSFTTGQSMRLGDYSWLPGGGAPAFDRTKLVKDPRIGPWWVLDPVPGGVPTVRLDLTGGGPMQVTVAARQSWGV
mgnify:CR=1 FL=1